MTRAGVLEAGRLRTVNPATGELVFEGASATRAEVAAAVARSALGQQDWSRSPHEQRAAVLRGFADLLERDAEALASLIVAEMGKCRAEAEGEVAWTITSARWYADHPPPTERAGSALVSRIPLGVVAVITPWNVPLVGGAWKWLPALMAGNAVVWKASELAAGVATRAALLLNEAGLPDGVLELVLGDGITGRALIDDERVAGVHFTGSTATGRRIAATVAPRLIPCALELGGLNPVLVFEDADLDAAADCIVTAGTSINGQKCSATRRVLVADSAASKLGEALADRIVDLAVGDPADSRTELGPLVTVRASAAAADEVAAAGSRGATVVARSDGGPRREYFPATLVAGVRPDDPLCSRELFAPVVSIEPFSSDSDGWALANATPYGLTAAIHTRDPARIAAAPERLAAGVINVNRRGDAVDLEAPFGGLGMSGNGFPEGGSYVYSSLTSLRACYGADLR